MLLLLMGLKKSTAMYACVWCKVEDTKRYSYTHMHRSKGNGNFYRWDTDVQDSEYLIRCKRTLDNIIKDHSKKKYSCKHLPLIQIEPDHIVPDELH